ncbi:hypothetical protein V6N11_059349 [Hibiscus sabdariffa]|uniref:Uncharacterized protein n=1 Tax=Hibiscus sabdariffa TaxID=183260 RepID=A0ABR2U7N5_9ROSI
MHDCWTRRRPPRGGLVVPASDFTTTPGAEGRTGPPQGGEVDPTCKAGKPSQLPPTARTAQASFRPHQVTSRWRVEAQPCIAQENQGSIPIPPHKFQSRIVKGFAQDKDIEDSPLTISPKG